MGVNEINDSEFQKMVLQSLLPVVVDFWAPWCGPCKQLAPIMTELSEEMGSHVIFYKIDIDQYSEYAGQFGVMSIPALMIFQDGECIANRVGTSSKAQIKKWITDSLSDA